MRKFILIFLLFPFISKSQIVVDTTIYISADGDTIKVPHYSNAGTSTIPRATRLNDSMVVVRALIALKQNSLGFTPYNATNPNGYISAVPAQTFVSITGKPTTLLGYGITDAAALSHTHAYNTLTSLPTLFTQSNADALYSVLAHTHSFSILTSKPTTLSGYGITDAYPLSGNPSGFLVVADISGKANITSQTFITPNIGVAAGTSLATSGNITSSGGGIGYVSGNGGAQTQATNKTTTVVLNKLSGEITLNNAALAAATIVSFTLTNSTISATDVMILNHVTTGTRGAYTLNAQCANGSAVIYIRNNTAGSLGEAMVIKYVVIKGALN